MENITSSVNSTGDTGGSCTPWYFATLFAWSIICVSIVVMLLCLSFICCIRIRGKSKSDTFYGNYRAQFYRQYSTVSGPAFISDAARCDIYGLGDKKDVDMGHKKPLQMTSTRPLAANSPGFMSSNLSLGGVRCPGSSVDPLKDHKQCDKYKFSSSRNLRNGSSASDNEIGYLTRAVSDRWLMEG